MSPSQQQLRVNAHAAAYARHRGVVCCNSQATVARLSHFSERRIYAPTHTKPTGRIVLLSTNAITCTKHAEFYFRHSLQQEDYYLNDLETPGTWHGAGAKMLRLEGRVDQADYFKLVNNEHPNRAGTLTVRNNPRRRIGWDFTWNAPKGVSVLHAMTGDHRIQEVFQAAAQATMKEIEAEIKTRVRRNGRNEDRVTGNAIWASFTHYTARPVGGVPDMHLHQHNVIFNATYDPQEERWKAVQIGDIKRDAPFFEAVFHARVATGLRELGYSIRRKGRYWDVKHVPERVVKEFSRRTEVIEEEARRLGIKSAKAKAKLGATTREPKSRAFGIQELQKKWARRISTAEADELMRVRFMPDATPEVSAEAAIEYAVGHLLSRQSVVRERVLLSEALRFGIGSLGLAEVERAYQQREDLIRRERDGCMMITSREVLAEEERMITATVAGRGQLKPIVPGALHFDLMEFDSDEQRGAVEHLLKSRDRVATVHGMSGTGKSTMMSRFAQRAEIEGYRVYAFSPGVLASRHGQRNLGFEGADTVARLLKNLDRQRQIKGQIVWVDEAGQLGVRDMRRLVELADAKNARLILTGDTRQHAPVPRGDALRLLEDIGAVQPYELKQIRRQRGKYREIVAALADHQTERAFEMLHAEGWIKEIESEERYRMLAADYLDAIDDGKSALVVCPTHAEGHDVNQVIREGLRERGLIHGEEKGVWQLRDLHLSDDQKKDTAAYEVGQVVRFTQNAKGVVRGSTHEIVEVRDRDVLMEDDNGRRRQVPLHHADRFDLCEQHTLWMTEGEELRLTRGGLTKCKRHSLDKGMTYKLAAVLENGDLLLENGWLLDKRYGGLGHPYLQTSHGAQGADVEVVLLAQSSRSFGAGSREQFYVSIGRGQEVVRVYTDDADELLAAITRSSARLTATELVEELGCEPVSSASREHAGVRVYRHSHEARERWHEERQAGRSMRERQHGWERELGDE